MEDQTTMRVSATSWLAAFSTSLFLMVAPAVAEQHDHHATAAALSNVHLATTCRGAVSGMFDRGVTLLHAFWFDAAFKAFSQVAHSDVDCAMAWWGIAMAQWGDPLESARSARAIEDGRRSIAMANAARTGSPRERQYIAAAGILYDERIPDPIARQHSYASAMQRLAEQFPEDEEAAVFAALAALPGAVPSEHQRAARRLESLAHQHPNHPGLPMYLILALDQPGDAARALEAAKQYASAAPEAAFSLHVASHIFSRLGLWNESLAANLASADAARRDGAPHAELHALDYQVYALLQTRQDQLARSVVSRMTGLRDRLAAASPAPGAIADAEFALAAAPARFALERGDWKLAADLEVTATEFPWVDAITHFARGLGAARSGDIPRARAEHERLTAIRDTLIAQGNREWTNRVDILGQTIQAWLEFKNGQAEAALGLLVAAVAEDEALDMPRFAPGSLAPPRELLGEMLLEMGNRADALKEFQRVLRREPNRRRALDGAAQARAGMRDTQQSPPRTARLYPQSISHRVVSQ